VKVGAERQEALRQALERSGAERREAKGSGELWRYALDGANVTLWRTGTVRVQGKGEMLDVAERLVGEYAVPGADAKGSGRAATPPGMDLPRDRPWAGVDESGKGDYFGPLVSAAVVVDPSAVDALVAAGVQDSKKLTDKRVRTLAPQVRRLTRHALTRLVPPRYNALYADFRREGKRLNQLLAWAHIRSLRTLLEAPAGAPPAYAIVDQFADARVIDLAAKGWTADLRIVQFPRAEADVAVAAASILAREAFLDWLRDASARTGVELPKGASPQVVEAARTIAARGGRDALEQVAKLHFATTEKVLG
jgi:ribonuclease HIII